MYVICNKDYLPRRSNLCGFLFTPIASARLRCIRTKEFPLKAHSFSTLPPYVIATPLIFALSFALSGCCEQNAGNLSNSKKNDNSTKSAAVLTPTSSAKNAPKSFTNSSSSLSSARPQISAPKIKYNAGEDPEFAKRKGWPVKMPAPLPGSILPQKRIVTYYGNPLSKKMGALGEFPKDDMLSRLNKEVAKWNAADPATPVQPALHLIAVVAQSDPGKAGKYRMVIPDNIVNQVYEWAKENKSILFIDIQTGHEDIRTLLPRFEWLLKNPDVHLGIDPEFNLIKNKVKPGKKIGTYDAEDINYASGYLKDLVKKYNLPPKVFVIHRFTRNGVTNSDKITLRPEVQIVMHMDGWGAPWLKRDSYKDYIVAEPVQFTGFKLFYHNDTKKGDPLMTPQDVLKLNPKPLYIQYQ